MFTRPGSRDSRPQDGGGISDSRVRRTLTETLAYARERDYRGWDYADGTSSRLLGALPFEHDHVDLAVQETVKRFPVNLRPLFRVEQRRNMMGAALFAMANGTAGAVTGDGLYDREARSLVDWLVENRVEGYGGFCVCHPHDLQTLDGVVPVGTPGIVGTSYGVRALLWAADHFGEERYADVARTAADFLFEDLDYRPAETGARIAYKPTDSGEYVTINAVALGARMLVDLHERFGEPRFREGATELLAFVAAHQTDRGGWYYRDPPSASHLSMDSHHNGFVLETFQRYAEVVDGDRFAETLADGLAFYREELFAPDGAPHFDEESAYPRDVHAASQGILVFSYAGDHALARRVLEWTLDELYLGDGRFLFRKHRLHTKRHVLMRWCVAWMAYAIAEHARLVGAAGEDGVAGEDGAAGDVEGLPDGATASGGDDPPVTGPHRRDDTG